MFNVIEKNQKLVKGIMITVTASFVIWGVGGYLGMSGDDGYVAKVGGQKIYTRDIDQAMQDNPQQNTDKMQVLFGLINRQLLIDNINNFHMTATKEQMQHEIGSIPIFHNAEGKFDLTKYQNFLRDKYMSAEQFQKNVGQQIVINEMLDLFKNSYFTSKSFDNKFSELLSRQRNVSHYSIAPQQFYSKINVNESDINQFYQQNIAKFTLPEKVKLQYLIIDPRTVAGNIQVPNSELQKYISDHEATVSGEQVDVSHILFAVPSDANATTKAAVKAKAEKLLAEVKANPSKFAQYATDNSEDPGSAKKGGELGFITKGVMVKPFEDAAFSLKTGQISGLVETQFGYHILKVNAVKVNTPDDIKRTALTQLQKQKATAVMQQQLEQLNDLTYNQASSLDPAAKKLGIAVQNSNDWVIKGDTTSKFANPKIQGAIFNPDVLEKHNNSEVVDLGDGSHAVYRVTDYQKAKVQTLAEVKSQITEQLKTQMAAQMAAQMGQQQITGLQAGKIELPFTNPENVSLLSQSSDVDQMAIKQIFTTSITKLPAYTGGIDAKGNFVIYKINSENIDPKLNTQNKQVIQQFDQANSMLEMNAYVGSLRNKYSVDYKIDRLKQQSQ